MTQWRVGACGIYGLDYTALLAIAPVLGIPITPALFGLVRVLEQEHIQAYYAQQEQNYGRKYSNTH